MNNQKYQTKKLLHPAFNTKENVIKISRHEKFEHALAKFLLSYELMQTGQDIVTEAIFNNKNRADILALQEGKAYEILCSEKEANLVNKSRDYPVEVRGFNAKKVIEQSLKAYLR